MGQEDPLEKEMATHSSIFAWKNPVDRKAWQAMFHGVANSRMLLNTSTCVRTQTHTRIQTVTHFADYWSQLNVLKSSLNLEEIFQHTFFANMYLCAIKPEPSVSKLLCTLY